MLQRRPNWLQFLDQSLAFSCQIKNAPPPVVWTLATREDQLDLVARAQKGDRDAFDGLIDLHAADLFRLALAVAGPEAVQDVTQDALLTAWRELPSLRDPDRFLPWLRRILVNRSRDVGRGQRRLGGRPVSLDSVPSQRLELDSISDPAPRVDGLTDLHQALARLTIDQRAVIALHYLADLTLSDVATTLGIPLGTAKSRLNAALTMLRGDLGDRS